VNLASRGGGNDRIMRKLFEYYSLNSKDSNPLYIIAFSHSSRREEYILKHDEYRIVDLHPSPLVSRAGVFSWPVIINYNQEIASSRKLMFQSYILNFLKSNNLNYILADHMPDSSDELSQLQKTFPMVFDEVYITPNKIIDLSMLTSQYLPLECGHDGPEAQQFIADYIYEEAISRFSRVNSVAKPFTSLKEYSDYYSRSSEPDGENDWF
jgi:hypothetical protein